MELCDYVSSLINHVCDEDDFDLHLSNLLNYLWTMSEGSYIELANIKPDIDFDNILEIEHACKLFAIIRYVASSRKLVLKFSHVYYDKRVHLPNPYYGSNVDEQDCFRLLFTSPQPFYDYNVFYYPHSLEIL